jgi:hypothetical protein
MPPLKIALALAVNRKNLCAKAKAIVELSS